MCLCRVLLVHQWPPRGRHRNNWSNLRAVRSSVCVCCMPWPRVPFACFHLSFYYHVVFFQIRLHITHLTCHHWVLLSHPDTTQKNGWVLWVGFLWIPMAAGKLMSSPYLSFTVMFALVERTSRAFQQSFGSPEGIPWHITHKRITVRGNYNNYLTVFILYSTFVGKNTYQFKNIVPLVIRR